MCRHHPGRRRRGAAPGRRAGSGPPGRLLGWTGRLLPSRSCPTPSTRPPSCGSGPRRCPTRLRGAGAARRLPDWPAFLAAQGVPEEHWNDASTLEAEGQPHLFFQRVPEPQAGKNRVHVDLVAVSSSATVSACPSCIPATRTRSGSPSGASGSGAGSRCARSAAGCTAGRHQGHVLTFADWVGLRSR
ncbi:VOC family protein [Ornithinibacter aureus]|uniref:VOC family protein n=1 Tax=Ornithinibacter aureus TaxID=622664 RepID=UPI0024835281|nr:VOC family protein [Ornithinibacter aureus]